LIVLILAAVTKYHAKGPSIWLLVALTIGIFSFAIVNVFLLIAIKQFIDASQDNVLDAYKKLLNTGTAYAACNLITEICSDLGLWIFAMKYWTLACQLERLQMGKSLDENLQSNKAIFIVGLGLNLMAAVFTSLQYPSLSEKANNILLIMQIVFMIPLIMSCFFLFDAFRRFRKTRKPSQIINNRQVGLLSFAFCVFTVGFLVN